jgi:hypothetical protein
LSLKEKWSKTPNSLRSKSAIGIQRSQPYHAMGPPPPPILSILPFTLSTASLRK